MHEEGYEKSINEKMYIDERDAFLKGVENRAFYPNTVDRDIRILELLEEIEKSDGGFGR